MSKSGSFNVKMLDGIYSKKKLSGQDIIATPSLNPPVQKHYHSSLSDTSKVGFFNEGHDGRCWNQVVFDEVQENSVYGQDSALDERSGKKQGGYFVDLIEVNINDSIDTGYYNLNRDFLEVFPIRAKAVGIDDVFYPESPGGISSDPMSGIQDDTYVVCAYVDSDFGGTPVLKGFYDDSAFTLDTGSYSQKSFLTKSYSKKGKVVLVGFYNETLDKFTMASGSLTHPVLFSGSYVDVSGSVKKSMLQSAIAAFSSSKASPFAQANMRVIGDFVGVNETEILHLRNNWHFVSSGSRNVGDGNTISNGCIKQTWTSANSPSLSERDASSQFNLLPPIRRSYEYDIRDSNNVENRVKFVLTPSYDDYYVKHENYKEIAADQKSFIVGVDSLTTNTDEQLISTAINEPIGDELYERGIYKFLESFKTLKFKVSSSLTPLNVNEFQIGVHPLQIIRPYNLPKFPHGSGVDFVDDSLLPVGPFGIQNVIPLEGFDFFEPKRRVTPRIFVPEHYITGSIGGSTANTAMTTYNPEWAADPDGGRVLSHWSAHSTSIGSSLHGATAQLDVTSSFFDQTNASSDLRVSTFSNYIFGGIRPVVSSLSEFNDHFLRVNKKYSIAHKQTFNVASGTGPGLKAVGVKHAGVHAAYPFSASITFYSCSSGVIVDSIKLGPYFSTASSIAKNTIGTFSDLDNEVAGRYCLLPNGLDRNISPVQDPIGAKFNYSWHSSSIFRSEDAFGYFKPVTEVLFNDFSPFGLSTGSIKTEAVLFHEITGTFQNIDLNNYNTSSVQIDFLTTFEKENFFKNSSDRKKNSISYDNLYDSLCGKSNFDGMKNPLRTNLAHYCIGFTGSLDSGNILSSGSVAIAFLMSKNRGDGTVFSDNYGDVKDFPNALVIPGIRPFREDRELFNSKSYGLTRGTINWANVGVDVETPSQKIFFLGNDDLTNAKVASIDPDYCQTNGSFVDTTDKNLIGIGVEGCFGFKNYIRNEGTEHNQGFYDVVIKTMTNDHPSWFGDGNTKAHYYCTNFYGMTKDDVKELYSAYLDRTDTFKELFVHGKSSVSSDMKFSVDKRIPPDCYSNISHTIFLQYPKSYATASSAITAVTYSFVRNGPLTMSNYGRMSTENVSNFGDTSMLFTLMSESKDAGSLLSANNKDSIMFSNHDSNFIFVQDSSSVGSALEVGARATMPESGLVNLMTNSYGDFIARSSITDKRKWTFAKLSSSIEDPSVSHGDGAGTDIRFFAPNPYDINNSRIGVACSSSVIAQFGSDIITGDGYSAASGTMGYFTSDVGPNVSLLSDGTLKRRSTENSFIDFSTLKEFKWVAEPTMVASQINLWSGTTRIVASSSLQELTGVAGNVYPTIDNTNRIKSDAFVNLPVINASFAKLEADNVIAGPGRGGGDSASTKGEHLSSSVIFGGSGSMIFGFHSDEPVVAFMRKFKIKQFQKTQPGYGDDDYIKRVNQNMLHNLGTSILTESYSGPSFPVNSDSSLMMQKDGGKFNCSIYDNDVFSDNKLTGSSVRAKAISDVSEFSDYASSSMFFQKNNRVVFFNTNFGQFRHLMEQSLAGKMFSHKKDHSVYYTSSIGVDIPTGSLPLTDI